MSDDPQHDREELQQALDDLRRALLASSPGRFLFWLVERLNAGLMRLQRTKR